MPVQPSSMLWSVGAGAVCATGGSPLNACDRVPCPASVVHIEACYTYLYVQLFQYLAMVPVLHLLEGLAQAHMRVAVCGMCYKETQ